MFENTDKSLGTPTSGKNILIENILVDTYKSGISHIYKYDYVTFKNIRCLNPQSDEHRYMKTIPITFTSSSHCEINNLYAENVSGQVLEINAGTNFLLVKNSYFKNNHLGVIFGNNGAVGTINENISFENCVIAQNEESSSNRAITYNYSKNVYFNNCDIYGIVSGNYDLGYLCFDNCNFTYKEEDTYLFNLRNAWVIKNSFFNETIKVKSLSRGEIDIHIYYELDGRKSENTKDINLAMLPD